MNQALLRHVLPALTIVFLLVFPHLGYTPFLLYALPGTLAMWAVLRAEGRSFADLGLRRSGLTFRAVWIGGAAGLFFAVVSHRLLMPALEWLLELPPVDLSDFAHLRGNFFNYLFILVLAWLVAGLYEELVFRGFLFRFLRERLRLPRGGFVLTALLTSAIFAVYHYQQGPGGIINAFVFSAAISVVQYYTEGNLWYLTFFHGVYDTYGLTNLYLG